MDRRLASMEEAIERRVAERLGQEWDAMFDHLEQELDDPELFKKVLGILAAAGEEG